MSFRAFRSWQRLIMVGAVVALIVVGWPAQDEADGRSGGPSKIEGVVQVGGDPSPGWTVEFYASGPNGIELMASDTSGGDGEFRLGARPAVKDADVHYVHQFGKKYQVPAILINVTGGSSSPSTFATKSTAVRWADPPWRSSPRRKDGWGRHAGRC